MDIVGALIGCFIRSFVHNVVRSCLQGEERVELQVLAMDDTAPVQRVHVESIYAGEVRGFVDPSHSPPAAKLAAYHGPAEGFGEAPILHASKVIDG